MERVFVNSKAYIARASNKINFEYVYLKAGTGYDCAGQNKDIEEFIATAANLSWFSRLTFGATLPTGSEIDV